ncbi:MAG: hypothetical protein J5379_05605 [Clostridiales bacterium]|nr:hypothetical protein [Clostridiales bacterium]
MHKFKNVAAILMVSALILASVGCGKSKETTKKEKKEKKETSAEVIEKDETEEEATTSENEEVIEDASTFDAAMEAMSQDFYGYVQEKLGANPDKIHETDAAELTKEMAYSGKYYALSDKEEPRLDCCVFDSEKEALNRFMDEYYNPFNETFKPDMFKGEYQCVLEEGHGYIVVNGTDTCTTIFGDFYRSGREVYAGVYYEGNTIVIIMPKNNVKNERVEEVMKLLGLPTADGENT